MNKEELKKIWQSEENIAHIKGWDFSHIEGRYKSYEDELSWDYNAIVKSYLKPDSKILDIDTGGGEVLLSFGHPCHLTTATEGYPPNVGLCQETLGAKGIRVKAVTDYANTPFEDDEFDIIINRHGSYDANELYRILKPGGVFITQQVGEDNDRELVEFLLTQCEKPFPGMNLAKQTKLFKKAGFKILDSGEEYRPIEFYDVGALVWFARIIQWEFKDFSVDRCFDRLLEAERQIQQDGAIRGNVHRYLIVAKK
ncbi:MAG: methyltransferase domain-containing protein [Lachnospiraceae bacterium]|nr:methyltransferase domain-containing protein [Lachnospiraceae bacterium]